MTRYIQHAALTQSATKFIEFLYSNKIQYTIQHQDSQQDLNCGLVCVEIDEPITEKYFIYMDGQFDCVMDCFLGV